MASWYVKFWAMKVGASKVAFNQLYMHVWTGKGKEPRSYKLHSTGAGVTDLVSVFETSWLPVAADAKGVKPLTQPRVLENWGLDLTIEGNVLMKNKATAKFRFKNREIATPDFEYFDMCTGLIVSGEVKVSGTLHYVDDLQKARGRDERYGLPFDF